MSPAPAVPSAVVLGPVRTSANTNPSATSGVVFGPLAPAGTPQVPNPGGEGSTTATTAAGPGQLTPADLALAQQGFAQENLLAGLTQQTPDLPVQPKQPSIAGVPVRLQDLPFLATDTTGNLRLLPHAPPPANVSPVELIAAANGRLPANLVPLGVVNNGLLAERMEIMLSGGAGAAQGPGPDVPPPDNTPVQPAPDEEPPGPDGSMYLAPGAVPAADGDRLPIVLAPESGPERLPGWDVPSEPVPSEPAAPRVTATPAAVAPAVQPQASLWSRFVSFACFAAGALGAAWISDVSGTDTTRAPFPLLRPGLRRRPGVI